MPTALPASAGATLTPAEQASALAAFVQQRFRRFSSDDAAFVVREVSPTTGDIKELANRLKAALKARGFPVKHEAALNAAARLQGFSNWHDARSAPSTQGLQVTWWAAEGKPRQTFASWAEVGSNLADFCDTWLATHGGRAFQVHVAPNRFSVTIPAQEVESDDFGRRPIAGVLPQGWAGDWLAGAMSALEHLRRRMEETGKAVLDGFAVAQLCHSNGPTNFLGGTAADATNSELVLREELPSGEAAEIGRGDEMACWSELDLVLPTQDDAVLDPSGAWSIAGRRFTWHVQTTTSVQSSVVLGTVPLKSEQSRRLLRRYVNARRILRSELVRYEPHRDLAYLEATPETLGVNLEELLLRMERQGLTWGDYCKQSGQTVEKSPALPRDFLFCLLKRLDTRDPGSVLLEPDSAHLSLVETDEMLTHLMPRISSVRHRLCAQVSPDNERQLSSALAAFEQASTEMQANAEGDMLREQKRLPHSKFARRATELRACVTSMGLDLYAGLMWDLQPNETKPEDYDLPGATFWPYGISLALVLEVAEKPLA